MIDLHTHTTASDGTDTPGELVRIASEIPTPETLHLVDFIRGSHRGIARE